MSVYTTSQPLSGRKMGVWQGIIYFANYGARGFYLPFISLYLLSIGFTPVEIGVLNAVSAVFRLFVVPAYSAFVDRRGAHRRLLITQVLATSAATFGLVVWLNKLWMSMMFIGRDAVDTPAAALMAQLTITGYGARGAGMYGKLRAMGSLGWGVATLISGPLIALGAGVFAQSRYMFVILLSVLINALVLPLFRSFPERTAATNSRVDKPPKRLPAFWIIMASNFLFYVGANTMGLFMFVYFKDYLGADDAMIGVVAACLGLFEIPWMFAIHRFYRRMSTRTALLIGIAGQAVFMLSIAALTGTTLLIPLAALRGFFFALQNISQTVIVTEISHPANVATNQAITWVTMPALAAILTGPLAGWMYENADARLIWILIAVVMMAGALLLVFGRGMIEHARETRLQLHVN